MELTAKQAKSDYKYSTIIGIGLALFPLHNLWLSESTSINGQVWLHLPAIGTAIWIISTLFFLRDNYKRINLGSKYVYIPLIIICVSIAISGFISDSVLPTDKMSPLFMAVILFGSYLVAGILGLSLFYMLVPFVILGSIIAIVIGLLNPGMPASEVNGMITNYAAGAGFLIFGAIVNQGKYQWILCIVALIGVFFIGAIEAVFIVSVIGITILIRRDFSKKLLIIAGSLVVVAGIWLVLGYLTPLYTGNGNILALFNVASGQSSINDSSMHDLTSGRWEIIIASLHDIRVFGHGFSLSTVGGGIVHNIPLIILYQIGILGALSFTFITIYCLIKTKFKYAWIMVIAMGVFDHYIWTQFTPYFWILVGISLNSRIKNDYIFKEQHENLFT